MHRSVAVDRVAELVDADALVVVAVERQAEQVLLAEARRPAAGAADALVLVGRVRMVAVLRHVGVDLVLADDDQVHAVLHHRLEDVRPAGEHVRDDRHGALERLVGDLRRRHDRHAVHVDVFLVELARRLAVVRVDDLEERSGGAVTGNAAAVVPAGRVQPMRARGGGVVAL